MVLCDIDRILEATHRYTDRRGNITHLCDQHALEALGRDLPTTPRSRRIPLRDQTGGTTFLEPLAPPTQPTPEPQPEQP